MSFAIKKNFKTLLSKISPAASSVKLGDLIEEMCTKHDALATAHNALVAKHNSLLAKLDADAGVTDVNYASTQNIAAVTGATLGSLVDRS